MLTLCLFTGIAMSFIPTVDAQGNADQSPNLLIKVPNIENLLNNVQHLIPEAQAANAENQITGVRRMLFGTGWIDPERCIVAGMVTQGAQTQWIALIPFLAPNPDFQKSYGAIAGSDYYLTTVPPQPGFTVSPSVEDSLALASRTPAAGSLVVEAAAANLIAMAEPLIAASLTKMEEAQTAETPPTDLSPQNIQAILNEMLAIGKQAKTLRFGIDITGDVLTLLMDIDALPDTALSRALVDPGGNTRLEDYPIDMPIQLQRRAFNITSTMDLLKPYLEAVYGQMGLDIVVDDMVKMAEYGTGEMAGGMNITANGLEIEFITVLKPGIDGEAFIRDNYLPMLHGLGKSVSESSTEQSKKPITVNFERTADSRVAGINVVGVKAAIITADRKEQKIFEKLNMEFRMAAVDDLIFIASDDAKIEKSINGTRSLVTSPARGPMGRFTIDLTSLFQGIRSLLPPEMASFPFPDNIGKIAAQYEVQNGTLTTRTSFNISDINRLVSTIGSQIAKQKPAPVGNNN